MAEQWIQSAIKRPGALRAKAKRAGAITERGTIDREWLEQQARKKGRTGQQARLAITLRGLPKPGRKEAEMAGKAVRRAAKREH